MHLHVNMNKSPRSTSVQMNVSMTPEKQTPGVSPCWFGFFNAPEILLKIICYCNLLTQSFTSILTVLPSKENITISRGALLAKHQPLSGPNRKCVNVVHVSKKLSSPSLLLLLRRTIITHSKGVSRG